ncbi:ornithine decarboxylase 1-like isoform X1 [Anthonomus grandis grandis]|uniref:ornithine decarboxylase 1-like isoform X1 n=1 Tax=Anthonomus grandis grandis TaxID=2921223 RepID=UPI00216598E9|nr:ornithine decarboxylase 1-like isoform X1 [Anthonomus grandis grandis]
MDEGKLATMKFPKSQHALTELKSDPAVLSIIKYFTEKVDQEEAFYICNLNDIIERHDMWKYYLPNVAPYYAVKCHDDKHVLEVMTSKGINFDCASKAEISKVLSTGCSTDRIIFANPAKPIGHIKFAAEVGVNTMTFDNESELVKIQKLYPSASLVIRIKCEAIDAVRPLGKKFGCDPVKEVPRLLRLAESLNLNVIGVSFHVGSGCREPEVFWRAISEARNIFNYASTFGYKFTLLDIGGGYPGGHGTSIKKIAGIVNSALDTYFHDLPDVKYIAEPGRYFVTSAYTLTCNIYSIRNIYDENNNEITHKMYYINEGVYGSFNRILRAHRTLDPITLSKKPDLDKSKHMSSSIWGPSCDGLDQLVEDMELPDLEVGDWMVFEDMGAYTLSAGCAFNGFPLPKVHYCITQNEWLNVKDTLSLPKAKLIIVNEKEPKLETFESAYDKCRI